MRAATLSNNPRIGRIVPEIGTDEIREVFIYSYRIIYQILPKHISILAIVHGNKDLIKTGIGLPS